MRRRRRHFTGKLLLYNLILFCVIMLVLTTVFYFRVWRDTDKRAQRDFRALAEKTSAQFDQLVYNMDKTALQIAANPNIVTRFGRIPKQAEDNYFINNPLVAGDVVRLLNSYNFKRDGNSRICLYNDYHDFVYSATTMTTVEGVEKFFETKDYHRVKELFSEEDVFSLLRPPGDDILNTSDLPSPDYFSVVRQIKDYYSGTQKNGYVEVQQSVEHLDAIFGNLGEGCYAAVYAPSGHSRAERKNSDDLQLIYKSPSLSTARNEAIGLWFETYEPGPAKEGTAREDIGFTAAYQTKELELTVAFIKETGTVTAPLYDFLVLLILMFLILLAVVFVTEKKLIAYLTRPLLELERSVRHVGIDNLKLDIEKDEDSDELRSLNNVFNAVLSRLDQEIEQRISSQTNELKAHLFALQSQMNPHFIFNTLAIISMEAELSGQEKIVVMTRALADMLKYTSSMGDGTASLCEELRHAENYLALMKQRYEDTFEYVIETDQLTEKQSVSKLLIQPICENCFKHGFADHEGIKRISVRAQATKSGWQVTVEDNGSGIDPALIEDFERFKQNLSLDTLRHTLATSEAGGLTLENTCLRLYLMYGEHFIFRIENTGRGTRVTLGGEIE